MGHWDRWRDRSGWDYYSESRPRKVEGGIKAKSERGAIGETWWSKRWVNTLESLGMGARLTRGRSYARQGQVVSLDVEPGVVHAKVQGSLRQPYKIKIQLEPLTNKEWDAVIEAMTAQALFAAKLLAGEMPPTIEEAFNTAHVSLFPKTAADLKTSCSCPDWANPCKHIAAVYYILAERFDEDPFLIFKLRGRTKEAIIAALREKRAEAHSDEQVGVSAHPGETREEGPTLRLEDHLDTFWQAGDGLEHFVIKPDAPEVDKAVLKLLGDGPFEIGGKNIKSLLEKAYDHVSATVQGES